MEREAAELLESKLNIDADLPDVWNERAIEARGERFVSLLLQAFPRPATGASAVEAPEPVDDDDVDEQASDEQDETTLTLSRPGVVRSVPGHIRDALQRAAPGAALTVSELSRARHLSLSPAAAPTRTRSGAI